MSSVAHHSQNTGEQHLLFMCIPLSACNYSTKLASYPGIRVCLVLILRMQSSKLDSNMPRCADNVANIASNLIWANWMLHPIPDHSCSHQQMSMHAQQCLLRTSFNSHT